MEYSVASTMPKVGKQGILYRTSAPKLYAVNPTAKPKIIENNSENCRMGYCLNILVKLAPLDLLERESAMTPNEKRASDSKELSAMSGLLISQGKGLKNVVIRAIGALVINPNVEKSVLPKLYEEPS